MAQAVSEAARFETVRVVAAGARTTSGGKMQTRAAVAWKAGEPPTTETIDMAGPRPGEVLVEIMATGICHTDAYTLSGADPEGIFPAILGHGSAGVVREIGPGVPSVRPGDHVIP